MTGSCVPVPADRGIPALGSETLTEFGAPPYRRFAPLETFVAHLDPLQSPGDRTVNLTEALPGLRSSEADPVDGAERLAVPPPPA